MYMEVEGARSRVKQRRPGWNGFKNYIKGLGLASVDGPSRTVVLGGGRLWGTHADPGLSGAPLGSFPRWQGPCVLISFSVFFFVSVTASFSTYMRFTIYTVTP